MRNPNRIPIVLERINWIYFLVLVLNTPTPIQVATLNTKIVENLPEIERIWKQYPDLRLGQLLINFFEFPDQNKLWNIEEIDYLIEEENVPLEEVCFWGVNYFKNGEPRAKTKHVLLKDLTNNHIENIITFFNERGIKLYSKYEDYFKKRLSDDKSKTS